ncbi:MAG TPA: M36 family metallopeptidase, partial [Chitinophagaceae bacterium]|nr:M36 family metallopeptidase [Chitinophagaceae bacterium]
MQKLLLLFLFVNLFADRIFGQVNDQENNLARQLVGAHVSKIGLTPGDLSNSAVVNTYSVPGKPGLRMVYLQQTFLGIPVFNELQVLAFNGENLVSQTGTRIIGVENKLKAKTGVPGISAVSAVQATMTHLKLGIPDDIAAREIPATARKYGFGNLGIASENITAELMWFPLDKSKKELRLVWQVFIAPKNSADYWLVRVDANDGQVLGRQNLTITCNWDLQKHSVSSPISGKHNPETGKWKNEKPAWNYKPYSVNSASYRVIKFPAESPNHPGGAPSLHTDPWTMAPGNATSLGWHFDGIINHDSTRGNNVWAQEDRDASNTTFGKAAVSTTPQPTLSFNYLYDFTSSPVDEATNNQKASITNLFYWNNIMHDISYLYGFDEASGNFQSFNQGRGGLDEDYVVADAQDNNGSSNANFATPPDGSRPRMQMYLWTNPNPDRDGDLDNGIVAHEYSHGISNRLTGGPSNTSCLSNEEHGGEGWSDYYSLMVTTNWATATINDGALGRGVGTYVVNQPITGQGIRNFRYSTDMAINPLVYEASLPTQVHSRGEYWCTALWEMTWEIIQQAGINPNLFNPSAGGGNAIALKLVTEGLRLQPCSPGFIDARDAILRADTLFFGGQYSCAIWKAFAKRGMGRNASQGSSESVSDQVPSFLADNSTLTITQSVTQVEEGTNVTFTNHVTAGSCSPLVNAYITDTLPLTVTYVSGGSYNTANRTVSFGPINLASLQSQDFSYTVTVNNGTYFAPQQLLNETVAGITIPPSWTPTSSFATDWTISSTQSHSPSNSFFAPDPIELSDHSLSTTASYTLQAGSSAYSTLSFWHRFNTEDGWDGGVVEISTNNGASWTDLGPKMIQNGYNGALGSGSGNSLGGSKAFTGFLSSFMKTIIDLSSYSGQSVKIRFRFASDDNTAPPGGGWFVDDIELNTEPVIATRSYLFNSSSTLLTQADTITKILQSSICVPVSIIGQPADEDTCSGNNVEFTVTASGSSLNYQWEVNTGAGFIAIANLAPYVGVNSATLNIGSITTAMNNNQYRCIISNTCSADTSETVLLGVT